MRREHLGAALIGLMACATMAGSVSGLVAFAQLGEPGEINGIPLGTIAFVAGIDGLAIALTILAHRKGSTDWAAFGGLMVVTTVSTVLQVAAAWEHGPAAIIVHGSPAPCTAVAAFFLLRSLGHGDTLPHPPPIQSAESTGGLNVEAPASEQESAAAEPLPATEDPPTSGPQRRPIPSARETQGSGGRKGRSRSGGSAPLPFEELVDATARRLMEDGRGLSKRQVEATVREITGSCSRETRDRVHEALLVEDAMSPETSGTSTDTNRDQSHAANLTMGDHDAS